MKASIFVAASGATAAFAAGPLAKKDLEIKYVTDVVYVTVTEGEPIPTYAPTTTAEVYPIITPEVSVQAFIPEPTYEVEEAKPTYPAVDVPEEAPTDYSSTAVYAHNKARSIHQAPAVSWSDEHAGYAQEAAEKCVFEHDL
jgi:uncharacterized protein YkwD